MHNVSIGSGNDGTNPEGAATLVVPGPCPDSQEDSQVIVAFILSGLCWLYIDYANSFVNVCSNIHP